MSAAAGRLRKIKRKCAQGEARARARSAADPVGGRAFVHALRTGALRGAPSTSPRRTRRSAERSLERSPTSPRPVHQVASRGTASSAPTTRLRRQPLHRSAVSHPQVRAEYSVSGFASVETARMWVARFVDYYNHDHQHSGIGFVALADRHVGNDVEILAALRAVYARGKRVHPERWSGAGRTWSRPLVVTLNPQVEHRAERAA